MSRKEFNKKTKQEALRRSGMICEAFGKMYGLPAGKRCANSLGDGVNYDHIVMDALSKDNSLDNCAAVCVKCHRWKTAKHDVPANSKAKRIDEKRTGLRSPKAKIHSPGFAKAEKAPKPASKKDALPPLPPRQLYTSNKGKTK